MTPYEPRHEKTSLGTDHLIFFFFWGGGSGGNGGRGLGFFLKIFFRYKKKKKKKKKKNRDFFFSQSESQNIFFRSKQKQNIVFFFFFFFFSKPHICSKCILLDIYVRVFLEPNIHGYIVYMFVYSCILDIWVRVYMSRDMTKPTKWRPAKTQISEAPPRPEANDIWKYQIKWNHFHHMGPEYFFSLFLRPYYFLVPLLSHMRTTKAQISLCIRAVQPAPLLFAA